jgi:Tol biopolymer transport system component
MKRTLLMSLLFISTALTAGVAWASPPVRVSPGVSATVASLAPGTRANVTSPRGKIAFVRGGHIWIMNANGTSPRRLTNATAHDSGLTWTANGKRITFLRRAKDAYGFYSIYRGVWSVKATGGGLRPIRGLPTPASRIVSIAWSPKGRYLAIARDYYGTSQGSKKALAVIDMHTGHVRFVRVFDSGWNGAIGRVAWSPSGKKLVLEARVTAGPFDPSFRFFSLATVDLSSGKFTELDLDAFPQSVDFFDVVWQPSGQNLISVALDESPTSSWRSKLEVLTPDGTPVRALQVLAAKPDANCGLTLGDCSPDGRWVAVGVDDSSARGSVRHSTVLLSLDGSTQRTLTTRGSQPAFSPR